MKFQQVILDKKPVRQSKEFLHRIHSCPQIISGRNFDYLDGTSMRRKTDQDMNLEKYLKLN